MNSKEAWDMMKGNGCEKKSLTNILDEMGFDKDSYMVIRRSGPELKVSDERDRNGYLKETEALSFGGNRYKNKNFAVVGGGKQEVIEGEMTDFEAIDSQMRAYSRLNGNGMSVNGLTGSNNGIYSAMENMGNEFILTKDPEIIRQLESQMHFASDQLAVPLSNGGTIMSEEYKTKWERAQHYSERAKVGRLNGTTQHPKHLTSPKRSSEQAKSAAMSGSSYSR